MTHQEYYDSLSNFKCDHYVRERKFQCKNHKITTVIQNRMGLNAFDDKSYILDDGITQLRHNHWRIKMIKKRIKLRPWSVKHIVMCWAKQHITMCEEKQLRS